MAAPFYREFQLAAPLGDLVACVWCLRGRSGDGGCTDNAQRAERVQRIPPDGCVELIFHLDDAFCQVAGQHLDRQPAAMVVGVWTGPIALAPPPCYDTVGVRIRPGCAAAFWRAAAHELTDVVVDATAVLGAGAASLLDRLRNTSDDRQRVREVEAFLRRRMRQREHRVARSVDRLVAARGHLSIDALARDAGVGQRWLERAFHEQVGVSPKTLSRIVRFQQVLAHPRESGWADVAIACGYADQSHLIRDFTQFAGETPRELLASQAAVADYFRRR